MNFIGQNSAIQPGLVLEKLENDWLPVQ